MQFSATSQSAFSISAHWLLPIAAMVGLTAWPQAASAGNTRTRPVAVQQEADPAIISGIGTPEAERMFGAPQGARATSYAPPVRVAGNNMGGGFLELMLGGGAHYNEPSRVEPARAPVARQANYAPNPVHQPVQRQIDPMFMRQEVDYAGSEAPGTLVVDTPSKFLYFVEGNGRAIRYGIGVGRPGFEWSGIKTISTRPNGRPGRRPPKCCCAAPICRPSWMAVPAIRWGRGRSTSARRCIASTAQPNPGRLAPMCRRAASA